MRHKLIILIFAVFSSSAWACPDLSGEYACENYGEIDNLTISQKTINKITTYRMAVAEDPLNRETEIIADGQVHSLPDDITGGGYNRTYKVNCQGNALIGEVNADYEYDETGNNDMVKGHMFFNLQISLVSKNELYQELNGYYDEKGTRTPDLWTSSCVRK